MRYVQQAAQRPNRCAVIPFMGSSSTKKGFIDCGVDLPGWDPHVYISIEAVEMMSGFIGWGPPDVTSKGKLDEKDARIAELEAELAEAQRFQDAAEYTMERFGAKVRQRPGPKPKAAA